MANTNTSIEWTDATWSPVTGCTKVSAGCKHCYAEGVAKRFWGDRKFTDVQTHPDRLDAPLRWRKPRRVFVNSMSDLFHEDVPDEFIDRVFAVMALAPQHTFQVLTKRPERMRAWVSDPETPFRVTRAMDSLHGTPRAAEEVRPIAGFPGYFASSHGTIYSERRGHRRHMRPDYGDQGHARVQLHREGESQRGKRMLVHRLVLETFVGQPPSPDAQGRHLDGNPRNNAAENLSWGEQGDNWGDSKRHGTHRRYSKLDQATVDAIRSRAAQGESGEALGREFGVSGTQVRNIVAGRQWATKALIGWPLPGVWLGVSAEDQATADERIPLLLETPAAVRFVSCEPLLGPIDVTVLQRSDGWQVDSLRGIYSHSCDEGFDHPAAYEEVPGGPHLDWVLVGGESGPNARPCDVAWIRSIVEQCGEAGLACFVKQLGAVPFVGDGKHTHVSGYRGYGVVCDQGDPCPHCGKHPITQWPSLVLRDRKGSDPSEWPDDLRVREFPR